MEELKCTKCKSIKPSDEFYNDKKKTNGKSSICKLCQQSYKKNIGKSTRWRTNYKCSTCKLSYPITEYKTFESGGRSRNCKSCVKDNIDNRAFELWYNNNKEQCDRFIKHLREVTGIHGEEDLLKKYKP
jgi:hypothetical protein